MERSFNFAIALVLTSLPLAAVVAQDTGAGPTFDKSEVAWAEQPGFSTLEGQPDFTLNGRTFKCVDVSLIPYSKFQDALVRYFHGDDLSSVTYFGQNEKPVPRWVKHGDKRSLKEWFSQKTWIENCDSNGFARFTALPAGTYFVESMYIIGTAYSGVSNPSRGFIAAPYKVGFTITKKIEVGPRDAIEFDATGLKAKK